jgi:hypothetical protein
VSSAGPEPACLLAAVLELVCVCCRSRAVVSAADLEKVRMLQVFSRRVFFSFRAGLSSGGLHCRVSLSSAGLEPVCLHVGVLGASVCVCCRSRAGVPASDLEQVCLLLQVFIYIAGEPAGPEQVLLHEADLCR